MNLTRVEDGRNIVAEEIACLAPDTREAIDRLDQIEEAILRDLGEFDTAIKIAHRALRSAVGNHQLLRSELRDDRAEVERRLLAVQQGMERLGYPHLLALPKFRVVGEFPEGDKAG